MIRLAASALACSLLAHTQTPATPSKARPKVGLALAGGSARGLAHVGVVKWLQEHRIPIDYVAGTSMGGLIGGLYATGYDYEEIAAFIREIDWPLALATGPSFEQLSYRRKEDRRNYAGGLELGLKGGPKLPAGLSPGHGVGLVLSRFTAPYGELKSFDDLPTPFRCAAVDLREGTEVMFRDGSLFDALRSTMSLPGIFAPWNVGEKSHIDGGLLNNLPVDAVKAMGADIVIAVSLSIPAPDKSPDSLLGVASRTVDVVLSSNERRSMGMADILLIPDLAGLSSTDFQRSADFELRGYDSAAKKAGILELLAVDEAAWEAHRNGRQAKRRRPPPDVQFTKVQGTPGWATSPGSSGNVNPRLPIENLKAFENDLTLLTGFGKYQSAHYRYVQQDGKSGVEIITREKTHGPPFLNISSLIDGVSNEGLRFGIGGRLTFLGAGAPNSEVRVDFSAGVGRNGASLEYYQPISGNWFLAPSVRYDDITFDVYGGKNKLEGYKFRRLGGTIDLGLAAGRKDEIRFGFSYSGERVSPYVGSPSLEDTKGQASALQLVWNHEGQDSPVLPTSGLRVRTETAWVFDSAISRRAYPSGEALVVWARPVSSKFVLLTKASGGAAGNGQLMFPPHAVGGLYRLSALGRNQQFGNRAYLGEAYLLRSLFKKEGLLFVNRLYVGVGYEMGKAFLTGIGSARPYNDGVLGLMGETPLGFIFFGGSYGETGQRKFYFRLGRTF